MKILYIHQYFVTPQQAGGARSYYLSKMLADNGHDVVVLTSNTRRMDWPFVRAEMVGDVKVIYIRNAYDGRMGKFARMLSYGRFVLFSTWFSLREEGVDIVFASSTPITIGVPALAVRYLRRRPYILELRDLWPDVPFELGFIRSRMFYGVMKKFETWLYRKAAKIITVADGARTKVGAEHRSKTHTFPFGANLTMFSTGKCGRWKIDNGIGAPVLYVFTGAVGIANGVEYLVEAARGLQEAGRSNIHVAIVGRGSAEERVRALIERYELKNISMHEPVAVETLNEVYAAADAGIILFGDSSESYRETASPNKLFDYVAAGLPFFFNFSGPLKKALVESRVGVYTDYRDPTKLRDAMIYFADHPEELREMSVNARQYAKEQDREKILAALCREIEKTAV